MAASDQTPETLPWSALIQGQLQRYASSLLQSVARQLLRHRNQWPDEELIQRCLEAFNNPAILDRRIKSLTPAARQLLIILAKTRQPRWQASSLDALQGAIDGLPGLHGAREMLEAGLLYPCLPESLTRLESFDDLSALVENAGLEYVVHPAILDRARNEPLELPPLPSQPLEVADPDLPDGLDFLLRLGVLWQEVARAPIRLTNLGWLYKRDQVRLQNDPLLNVPLLESSLAVPDAGILLLELARGTGWLAEVDGELRAQSIPGTWGNDLAPVLASFWTAWPNVRSWDPVGGAERSIFGKTFPPVAIFTLLLLATMPAGQWCRARDLRDQLAARQSFWERMLSPAATGETWLIQLLRTLAVPTRLVETVEHEDTYWFRLGDIGRALLCGVPLPHLKPSHSQTLIVQPNGEIIVFRQGLTPAIIARLSRFAEWRTIGAACTMELTAESIYRGLESGLTAGEIRQTLEQHGTRAIPPTVDDSLQRWAQKRERLSVFSSATLLEFLTAEDLDTAFRRGLVTQKLTERIGLIADGQEIEYRHFRLIGNRDYEARPQQCLHFEPDGVTFTVDTAHSDLLLEAELARLAEAVPAGDPAIRRYRLTPASLKQAEAQGLTLTALEQWYQDRAGAPLSASARLLFGGSIERSGVYRTCLVIQFATELLTDGVSQWPGTGRFIEERLGPCAVTVSVDNLAALQQELQQLGIAIAARP